MPRRIKKATIKRISLVPRGANQLPVLYKEDGSFALDALHKFDSEQGELTAVVYPVDKIDSQGDYADADSVKQMLYDASKDGLPDINIMHKGEAVTRDQAFVAQSFLVQKGDDRFKDLTDYSGNPVDATGAWAVVIKIEDEELRAAYKDGKWNGVSMEGVAEVEQMKSEGGSLEGLLRNFLTKINLLPNNEEDDMKKEEVEALLKSNNEALLGQVKELLKSDDDGEIKFEGDLNNPEHIKAHLAKVEAAKAGTGDTDDVIKFEGDPNNVEDLKKHAAKVEAAKFDANDPEALAARIAKLEKGGKEEDENLTPEQKEIAKLEAQIAKIRKGSNAGTDTGGDPEHQAVVKKAASMAARSQFARPAK